MSSKKKGRKWSTNVSLNRGSIYIVENVMDMTNLNFSNSLDRIIQEYENMRLSKLQNIERQDKDVKEKYYPEDKQ